MLLSLTITICDYSILLLLLCLSVIRVSGGYSCDYISAWAPLVYSLEQYDWGMILGVSHIQEGFGFMGYHCYFIATTIRVMTLIMIVLHIFLLS